MRIEQLEYLLEISKNKSLNVTSQKLHISHQSLNKSINSLEQEIGAKLLNRSAKGINLTKDGEKTVAMAKVILDNISELKAQINNDKNKSQTSVLKGNLSIVAAPLAANAVSSILSEYNRLYPFVNITMIETDPLKVINQVVEGHYNIGFTHIELDFLKTLDNSQTNYEILFSEKAFLTCGKNSTLAKYKSISTSTFLKQSLILYSYTNKNDNWLVPIMERYGKINSCIFTNNIKFFINSLINGTHVTVLTNTAFNMFTSQQKEQLIIIPLKNKIISAVVTLTSKKNPLSNQTTEFIALVKNKYCK